MSLPVKHISMEDLEKLAIKFDSTFESILQTMSVDVNNSGKIVHEVMNKDHSCLNNFIRRLFLDNHIIGIGRTLAIFEPKLSYSDDYIYQLKKKYEDIFRILTTEDYGLTIPLMYSIRIHKDIQRSQTIVEVHICLTNQFMYNNI